MVGPMLGQQVSNDKNLESNAFPFLTLAGPQSMFNPPQINGMIQMQKMGSGYYNMCKTCMMQWEHDDDHHEDGMWGMMDILKRK